MNTKHTVHEAQEPALNKGAVMGWFYCQLEIEGDRECVNQCQHCQEYYKPLTKKNEKNKKI
jgi:hypothetical protein